MPLLAVFTLLVPIRKHSLDHIWFFAYCADHYSHELRSARAGVRECMAFSQ